MAVDDNSERGGDVDVLPDAEVLRSQVRDKYRQVAVAPDERFHFHTGRPLAARLGYDQGVVDGLPDRAVESFAGVGNPFSLRQLVAGERVVDVGSGAGFDSFVAAGQVGPVGPGGGGRHDRGDARQVAPDRRGPRVRPRRVP